MIHYREEKQLLQHENAGRLTVISASIKSGGTDSGDEWDRWRNDDTRLSERGNQGIRIEVMKRENMMQVTRYILRPILPHTGIGIRIPLLFVIDYISDPASVSLLDSRNPGIQASRHRMTSSSFPGSGAE